MGHIYDSPGPVGLTPEQAERKRVAREEAARHFAGFQPMWLGGQDLLLKPVSSRFGAARLAGLFAIFICVVHALHILTPQPHPEGNAMTSIIDPVAMEAALRAGLDQSATISVRPVSSSGAGPHWAAAMARYVAIDARGLADEPPGLVVVDAWDAARWLSEREPHDGYYHFASTVEPVEPTDMMRSLRFSARLTTRALPLARTLDERIKAQLLDDLIDAGVSANDARRWFDQGGH